MNRKLVLTVIRWVMFICIVFLGLMYLNGALACYWAAGGPPIGNMWEHLFLVKLGYGVSLLAAGMMVFIVSSDGFGWRKAGYILILSAIIIICLSYPRVKEWLLVDKCLDSGGSWDKKHFDCLK